jgi:hypothetical protein
MSNSDLKHVLNVKADDEIADIAVYDGNMNVVSKGVGALTEALPAGLYRIKIRVGAETDEKLAALDRDQTVEFDQVPFASSIPLNNTIKTHEYHVAAAQQASQVVRKQLGTGASIMVFAREWSPEGNRSSGNPAQGLSLLDPAETVLSEIWKEADVRNDADRDASAGWRADVTPGSYFLRLELNDADKTVLMRPIFVSPGHQLQLFCLLGNHIVDEGGERNTIRRADLAAAAMVISPYGSFNPDDRLARLSELACNSLSRSRGLLPQSLIDDLLADKFDNPMLGLFGAHLLLRDRPDDTHLFRVVTDNLLKMLGPDHPDLQTLWWQRQDGNPIGDGRLHVLPMLRASWDLAVERSIKTLDVFSFGTFYSKLTRIIPSAPWMMLMDNDWAVSDDAIDDYLKAREHAHMSRAEAKSALKLAAFQKHYVQRAYTAVRGMLPARFSSYLPTWTADVPTVEVEPPAGGQLESAAPAPEGSTFSLQTNEKADLARTLGIPADVLDAILKRKGH